MLKDMTTGSPLKAILMMSLPVMLGNLFQQFYGMADAIIVGRMLGQNALAAVGATTSLYNMILWFVSGVTSGFAVAIAQCFGAGDLEKMRDRLGQSIVLAFGITTLATVVSLLGIRRLLALMNTPEEIMADACSYILVILGGLLATMVYNLAAAVLRALGDGRTPLYFLMLTSGLNIVMDILFIGSLHMGTAGAAWATVISQAVSGILCVWYMYRKFPQLHMKRKNWHFEMRDVTYMLGLGLPLGFNGIVTASGVIVFQFAINSFGAEAVAAYTAATKVDAIVSQPLAAYSVTMVNYVGQNYGAGKLQNIKKGVRQCFFLVLVTGIAGGVLMVTCGAFFAGLFLDASSTTVIGYAGEYLRITGVFLAVFGMLCMFRSAAQGMGDARIPIINGVVESVSRILWTMYLIPYGDFHQLCYANPVTWIVATVILIVLYKRKIRQVERQMGGNA